tara:strand:- start:555 stop:1487 length:933 start_codon:yes stop_codon:yes gene_type:complete
MIEKKYYILITIILFLIKLRKTNIKQLLRKNNVGKIYPYDNKKVVNLDLSNYNLNLINSKLRAKIFQIKKKKILIIDNFLKNPKTFEKIKKKLLLFRNDNFSAFPGIRIKINDFLNNEFDLFIRNYVSKLLDFPELSTYLRSHYTFSIITHSNKRLNLGNILPHTDCQRDEPYKNFKNSGIAFVIYLFDENKKYSGTSVYESREDLYDIFDYSLSENQIKFDHKDKDLLKYIISLINNPRHDGDKEERIYKKIFNIKAKYNRIGIYRTNYWHSADLDHYFFDKNQDLNKPRLTITGFYFPQYYIPNTQHD